MRLRNATATGLAGLALALAVPAVGHAAGSVRQIGTGGSQSDSVVITGHGLATPGSLIWDGNDTGSATVGGED